MSYAVVTDDQTIHEVDEITDSGNFVTKCQNLFNKEQVIVLSAPAGAPGAVVTCLRCIEPPAMPVPTVRRPRPVNAKPQWRQSRDLRAETVQGAKFAHKEIVAGLEWLERGAEGQFIEQGLDRLHLAYRFLGEILVTHHRITDDTLDDADDL